MLPKIRIEKIPAQFCDDHCAAYVKKVNKCMKQRSQNHCDHPDLRQVRRYMRPLKRRKKR